MKIYVWQGEGVLQDYGSGMVIVAAESPEQAWERLHREQPRAYWQLQIGAKHCEDDEDAQQYMAALPEDLESVIQPTAYELADLPVLVKWGGA